MSIQSINNSIASLDREIHGLENQIHVIEGNIARKQKEANTLLDKISREKDLKKVVSLNKDLANKNSEKSRFEKDKNLKSKTLADKRKKRVDLISSLAKEEKKELAKTKREQEEILALQRQISQEIASQKVASIRSIGAFRIADVEQIYDVFVSHASEDKEDFVNPFADLLKAKGLKVWYDDFVLEIGDSLRRSIDKGLRNSKFGIVVISHAFFMKEWPQKELDGLFAIETPLLPVWHKISKDEVKNYSPMMADIIGLNTTIFTIEEIAEKIAAKVKHKDV